MQVHYPVAAGRPQAVAESSTVFYQIFNLPDASLTGRNPPRPLLPPSLSSTRASPAARLPGWRSPCGARPEEEEASIVSIWTLVRFVHVLSAMVWVGGQLLLSLLVLPVLRRRLDPDSRASLTREVGVRFGLFTVAAFLPLQIATGISLAAHRGLTVRDLAEPGTAGPLARSSPCSRWCC
jgi:hypothetical protein